MKNVFYGEATSSAGVMCKTTPSIPNISFPTTAFNPKMEVADVGSFWLVSLCSILVLSIQR